MVTETTPQAVTPAYNALDDEKYINKIYDSNLESQKQTIQQGYDQNVSNLQAEQQKSQKKADTDLNRAYVEAARNQKNYSEVQNAYGLSSGAMAQARLAQNNQLQSDMTAIRNTQAQADAEVERQKSLLAKEYASEMAKAQADNDYQRAQALYEAAKNDEAILLELQKEAGQLMAGKLDYSILGALYGLTPEQIAKLQGTMGGYYAPAASSGTPSPGGTENKYNLTTNSGLPSAIIDAYNNAIASLSKPSAGSGNTPTKTPWGTM